MKNFFNAIGMADMEKVHSAMIAWILDDENDPECSSNSKGVVPTSNFSTLSISERSKILCKMFGESPQRTFKSIDTTIEWNDIDILIETVDNNNIEEVWVIENKLKSQEHKSREEKNVQKDADTDDENNIWQTKKYMNTVYNYKEYNSNNSHFLLLSLGGDEAKTAGWNPFTYKELSECLCCISKNCNNDIIREYTNAITNMTNELKSFLSDSANYGNYSHVFLKLKKSKKKDALKRNKINDKEKYIVENGLETIFQKQLLSKLINRLKEENLIATEAEETIYIEEWNGSATFAVIPCENWRKIDKFLKLQVEFQNGTFKVVLISNNIDRYRKANQIDRDLIEKKIKIFQKEACDHWNYQDSKELNNRKKPRISITKMMKDNWFENLDDFENEYEEAVNKAKKLFEQF